MNNERRGAGRKVVAQGSRLFEGLVSGLAGNEPTCAFFASRDSEDLKGVVHSHASPIEGARAMAKRDGMAERPTVSVHSNQTPKYQVGVFAQKNMKFKVLADPIEKQTSKGGKECGRDA